MEDAGMNVTLQAGRAWINGYFYTNTSALTLPLAVADGVLNRIDRIVIRWDLTDRTITAKVKSSTPSATPVAPALQRDADAYEICVADVLIGKGVTAISQANITDQRLNTAVCGMVAGVVQQIDTTTYFAQLEAWVQSIGEVLDENAATNLLGLVTGLMDRVTQLESAQGGGNAHADRKDNPHAVTAVQAGAMPISGGTFTNTAYALDSSDGSKRIRNIAYQTTDLVAGVSGVVTGAIYLIYE